MFTIPIFYIISAAIFGLIMGSFLNVVALRYNTGRSLEGRSGCYSCGHPLSWKELIPLFSWLFQKGRCRNCQSHVSSYYFFGELMTGIIFAGIAARGLLTSPDIFLTPSYSIGTLFLILVFSIYIVILQYDMRHKIIPDALSFTVAALAFISLFFFGFEGGIYMYVGFHVPTWMALVAGIIVPLPFVLLWLVSRGRWIGLGDPKLMVSIGWLLGISLGFSAVILSFWIGALYAVVILGGNALLKKRLLQTGKKSIMKQEVPFAPFLIMGTLIILVSAVNLFPL